MVSTVDPLLKDKVILVLDDEIDIRSFLSAYFDSIGAKVLTADNELSAWDIFQKNKIDLIISDVRIIKGNGMHFLKTIRECHYSTPLVFITGYSDFTYEEAIQNGAQAVLAKPFKLLDLRELVCNILSR